MRMTLLVFSLLATRFLQSAYAISGTFFNINSSDLAGKANITLCLNGIDQFTCQNYNVPAQQLHFTNNTPKHTYVNAGIKINSGGSIRNRGVSCQSIVNNFCIFNVSDTIPYDIRLNNPDYLIIGAGLRL